MENNNVRFFVLEDVQGLTLIQLFESERLDSEEIEKITNGVYINGFKVGNEIIQEENSLGKLYLTDITDEIIIVKEIKDYFGAGIHKIYIAVEYYDFNIFVFKQDTTGDIEFKKRILEPINENQAL